MKLQAVKDQQSTETVSTSERVNTLGKFPTSCKRRTSSFFATRWTPLVKPKDFHKKNSGENRQDTGTVKCAGIFPHKLASKRIAQPFTVFTFATQPPRIATTDVVDACPKQVKAMLATPGSGRVELTSQTKRTSVFFQVCRSPQPSF